MRDFRHVVRERLGALGLAPEREQEILAELADHLEDRCDALAWHGLGPHIAAEQAVEEVSNWNQLACEIHSAEEGDMNDRTRLIWIPGLAVFALTGVLLMAVQLGGMRPAAVWLDPRIPLLVYWPWLVVLPVIGAIGALWSRRAGGRLPAVFLAGVFPVMPFLALLVGFFPLLFFTDRHVAVGLKLLAWEMYLLNWVVIPGAALLLGTLPFLRNSTRKPA